MPETPAVDPEANELAAALRGAIRLVTRRLRQLRAEGELTLPQTSALARLEQYGPTTPGALAKIEQISPQAMGATLATLEERGLVERRSDPGDGRRAVMSLTDAGTALLLMRRGIRAEQLARALAAEFTPPELVSLQVAVPLLERLAQRL